MGPPVPSPFGKREKGVSGNVLHLSWGAILIAFFPMTWMGEIGVSAEAALNEPKIDGAGGGGGESQYPSPVKDYIKRKRRGAHNGLLER